VKVVKQDRRKKKEKYIKRKLNHASYDSLNVYNVHDMPSLLLLKTFFFLTQKRKRNKKEIRTLNKLANLIGRLKQ
jgi:hypothetical protein